MESPDWWIAFKAGIESMPPEQRCSLSEGKAVIEAGLVIDTPWIRKILAGAKTWEIRSKPNSRSGRIALCEKGGPIVATAMIGPSISIAAGDFDRHFSKHQVPAADLRAFYGDRPVYAWPLSDVQEIDPPIRYKHPGGGSWVKLSAENVTDFQRLQREG